MQRSELDKLLFTEELIKRTEVISTFRPFVSVCDLDTVAARINPGFRRDPGIAAFQAEFIELEQAYAPEGSTFYTIEAEDLVRRIEARARRARRSGQAIVNFDRYVFAGEGTSNWHFRLNVSRSSGSELIARPGSYESVETQLANLLAWIEQNKITSLAFTDDVVAHASTFIPIAEQLRQAQPGLQITAVVGICSSKEGWSGLEKLQDVQINVDAVMIVESSPKIEGDTSGMAIPDTRDSTIFGGKIGLLPDGRAASYPYFLPFSVPTTSRMQSKYKEKASVEWVDFNRRLVQYMERQMGRPFTVGRLVEKGFGVPTTSVDTLVDKLPVPSNEVRLDDYLSLMAEYID